MPVNGSKMAQTQMLNGESPATAVNVTDDREACPKQWVAALVKVHSERSVSKKLQGMGIECWVPTQSEVHQWSDRKKKVERVVIPMIVFVHVPQSTIRQLAFQPFILKLLTPPGQRTPAIIPDAQIHTLRFMLGQAESQVEMRERILRTGDHVRIVRGPLQGLEGELCKVEDGKPMVAVQVDALGYACISIDKADLTVEQ